MKKNIINKGVQCKITAHGTVLTVGTSYTAVLYYSPQIDTNRITAVATCTQMKVGDTEEPTCAFVFSAEDTAKLHNGNCILEIYDTNSKNNMFYDEVYAWVRATSLAK